MGEHVPVPWTVFGPVFKAGDANCIWIVCAEDVEISRHMIEANAEFIVRAANSHEDALEACRLIIRAYENADTAPEALDRAYAAIAKAEGGES